MTIRKNSGIFQRYLRRQSNLRHHHHHASCFPKNLVGYHGRFDKILQSLSLLILRQQPKKKNPVIFITPKKQNLTINLDLVILRWWEDSRPSFGSKGYKTSAQSNLFLPILHHQIPNISPSKPTSLKLDP